jgi:chromosome partitioning protein
LRETYGAQLFETVIQLTVKLADSAMAGKSIISFHQQSSAAAAYRALAEEVEKRVH